jgi:sulfate permease, SulP family
VNYVKKIFPFLEWFRGYHPGILKADIFAGLTVALVLIPQSMAYAQLAGLPVHYGLYASLLPPIVAALFGSSRQLATGPVAVVSLLTAVALEPLATAGSGQYIAYAVLLTLMVGLFQFILGVLRLGLIVNLLSHPVINGFSNAAAIIIATAQLPKMFGVQVDNAAYHYETVVEVLKSAGHYTHWPTLLMGIFAFGLMFFLKRLTPRIPSVLVAVVVTTTIAWATGFENIIYIDLKKINSADAKALIVTYNNLTQNSVTLREKRADLNQQKSDANNRKDDLAAIEIEKDIQITGLRINQKAAEIRVLRQKLRHFLFRKVEMPDGTIQFYPQNVLPENAKPSPSTWRMRVGEAPLDFNNLALSAGGQVVGAIPKGIPALKKVSLNWRVMAELLPFAFVIAMLGFMEAISIAKAMAAKTGQRIGPNRELIGQGLANIVGTLGQSYPVSGSFSRSAVNLQAGAVTGVSSIFSGLFVALTLLLFTPLLYHLPQSVLAAIIMVAVTGLINIKGFIHAFKAQWYDGVISVIVFISTLALAPHLDRGIAVGVVLSLGVFLYRSMRPNVVDLSLGADLALHDAVSYGLSQCRYIDVVRFDGPLFFLNASYLEDQIRMRRRTKKKLKHIIIAADGINDVDASGQEALSLTIDRVRAAGIGISVSGLNEAVAEVLQRTHLIAKIGADNIFPTIKRAVAAVHKQTHRGGLEKDCPLTTFSILKSEGEI